MCIVGSESDFSQFKSSRSFLSFFCGVRAQWPKVSCLSSWESILILALSNIAIRNQDIVWNKKWEAIPSTQTKAWVVYGCLVNRNVFSLERGGHSTQDRGRLGILIPAMSWTQRRWLHTDHSLVREVAEILPLKERPVTPLMLEVFLGERSFSSNPGSGGFPKLDPTDLMIDFLGINCQRGGQVRLQERRYPVCRSLQPTCQYEAVFIFRFVISHLSQVFNVGVRRFFLFAYLLSQLSSAIN